MYSALILSSAAAANSCKIEALYIVGWESGGPLQRGPGCACETVHGVRDIFSRKPHSRLTWSYPLLPPTRRGGSFTNTCGDLQFSPAADRAGEVKTNLEIIVRIAEHMPLAEKLVPFRPGLRGDMGQSRGRRSAKPIAVFR